MVLNEPCSCAGFFLLSEGVFLFEAANVFGKQFFFLTTTMTAIIAITKMNRMMRAAAVIIPASEVLSKIIMPSFPIYKPLYDDYQWRSLTPKVILPEHGPWLHGSDFVKLPRHSEPPNISVRITLLLANLVLFPQCALQFDQLLHWDHLQSTIISKVSYHKIKKL